MEKNKIFKPFLPNINLLKRLKKKINKKTIQIILVILMILSLPLTVKLVHQLQEIRQHAQTGSAPTAVTTYQSIGIYWSPTGGSNTNICSVKYRQQGTTAWKDALPLWYDGRALGGRPAEYRGSIVMLNPGTTYEIQLTLASGTTATTTATTWSENYPIAQTITVPSGGAYTITQGGSQTGYILYNGPATINGGSSQNAVTISASYVIVRSLTVTGGSENGIMVTNNAHDVIIEQNDISHWGPSCSGHSNCGELASGVRSDNGNYTHITIQRNKIHDPNANSNDSCDPSDYTHPNGPRGVSLSTESRNNVIRYNEISGNIDHLYNDVMGNNSNHSFDGFPVSDSDINGNLVSDSADEALEIEGADMNVRIWGNYLTRTFTGISGAAVAIGPEYIFRNVAGTSAKCIREIGGFGKPGEHGPFHKSGDSGGYGGGRHYLFNNTLLQIGGNGTGYSGGIADYGGPINNHVSRNNIWNISGGNCYSIGGGSNNDIDYDMCPGSTTGSHSIQGTPTFAQSFANDTLSPAGSFELASGSNGVDKGQILPNFTDGYQGSAPDMGAQESGAPKLEFGVNAYKTSVTPSTGPSQPQPSPQPSGVNPSQAPAGK